MPTSATHASPAAPPFRRPRLLEQIGDAARITLSAAEMAQRTGVGRERLRTWERRHGFPIPVRRPDNVRRYDVADVQRVIEVSRAVERGLPLPQAIAEVVQAPSDDRAAPLELGAALSHAPMPAVALRGPEPMTVAWLNGAAQALPDAPTVGQDVADRALGMGSGAATDLAELFLSKAAPARLIEHGDWSGGEPTGCRSVAWRLPAECSAEPIVVLLQLGVQAPSTRSTVDAVTPWLEAIRKGRRMLGRERGISAAQRALTAVADGSGAADAFLATCQRGQLRTATSVRGLLPAQTVALDGVPQLLAAARAGGCGWLDESGRRQLALPQHLSALVVPLAAAGELVGLAVLCFGEECMLPPAAEELLLGFAGLVAAGLQRDHLAACRGGDQMGR